MDKLVVYPENMKANMDKLGGLHNSQRMLLALTQAGVNREDSYRLVQRNAMKVWDKGADFAEELKADPEVSAQIIRRRNRRQIRHRLHVDTFLDGI